MNINELESKNIEPSVEELDLERIAWKVSRDPYRPQMSENDISRAVHQYRRFLSLKIRYPKVRLVPTEDIDLIWHTHILDTANYLSDCERLFGGFLHHYPNFGELGGQEDQEMEEEFRGTSDLWMREYGEELETPEVLRCAGKACHAPSNCRCR